MAAFAPSTASSGSHRDAKRSDGGEIFSFKMKASTVIWEGDIVVVDVTDGLVWALQDDGVGNLDTGDLFAGIAAESKVSGASAPMTINAYVTGIFEMNDATDTLAATDMGVEAYGDADIGGVGTSSSITIGTVPANLLTVGRIMPPLKAATTKPRIRIDGYAGCKAASS